MKPKVNVTLPVYNEEKALEGSVEELINFIQGLSEYDFMIVIADNASTDGTLAIAKELAEKHPNVKPLHLDEKGRGRALKASWTKHPADVMCYMDIDLSTDLKHLKPLIDSVLGDADTATGSRLMPKSEVGRSIKREILSRGYNILLKLFLGVGFSDAQCGFKAINKAAAENILPHVKDNEWFFDTELLVRSERAGLKVAEIPVKWVEDRDSKVAVARTSSDYIKSIFRLRSEL